MDSRLSATGGPSIIGLEFAGSQARAQQVIAEWGAHGRDLARLSLWLDFGFILSYGTFLSLRLLGTRDFARERSTRMLARAGLIAPYLAIGAASLDLAENVVWLSVLGGRGATLAPFATACASVKLGLIALAVAYLLWGRVVRVRHSRRSTAGPGR